jgi:hypothetical protein
MRRICSRPIRSGFPRAADRDVDELTRLQLPPELAIGNFASLSARGARDKLLKHPHCQQAYDQEAKAGHDLAARAGPLVTSSTSLAVAVHPCSLRRAPAKGGPDPTGAPLASPIRAERQQVARSAPVSSLFVGDSFAALGRNPLQSFAAPPEIEGSRMEKRLASCSAFF